VPDPISRRSFSTLTAGVVLGSTTNLAAADDKRSLQPKLIDAKGPHGFTLHFHAQVGGKEAEPVLSYTIGQETGTQAKSIPQEIRIRRQAFDVIKSASPIERKETVQIWASW
jgi:hypothetical protein